MKATLFYTFLFVSLVVATIHPVAATTVPADWWIRSGTSTVNNVTGYLVNATQTSTSRDVSLTASGSSIVYVGVKVHQSLSDNTTKELTGAAEYIQVSRSTNNTEGLQNVTWTAPETTLTVGYSALVFKVYLKLSAVGTWTLKTTLTTPRLVYKTLTATTWTLRLYTKKLYLEHSPTVNDTTGYFYWGSTTYQSSIEDLAFTEPSVYETIIYQLAQGNFLAAATLPYTNLVGNLFYGILLLVIEVPLYNRFHSTAPILITMILFGGVGGVFSLLIPEAGLQLAWLVMLFGLAGLLYSVFR